MARKIRCNDEVIVLTGKDKGKRGRVLRILSSDRAIVTGVNMIKKHQRKIPSTNQSGGIIAKEAAINISNLAIFNTVSCKSDRIGFRIKDGKKVRVLKSSGKVLD